MIKHGVVMVTSLIIILSLLGVVSASDITASDVDMQASNQEDTQIEIAQSSDTSAAEVESSFSSSNIEDIENELSVSISDGFEANIEDAALDLKVDDCEIVQAVSYDDSELSYECYCSDYSDGELLEIDVGEIIMDSVSCDFIASDMDGIDFAGAADDYDLGYDVTTLAYELFDFESAEDILVITAVDSSETSDVTTENVLNGIVDASNGYVTYGKGNLITLSSLKSDLTSITFFIKKGESLTMAFYKNGAITSLCSGDGSSEKSVNLRSILLCLYSGHAYECINIVDSWFNAFRKGVVAGESQQHFLTGQFGRDKAQTLLGDNNRLGLSDREILGIQEDSHGDAFIWSIDDTPDKSACFSADSMENESLIGLIMENNTSENGMITVMSYNQSNSDEILKVENNLNPDNNNAGGEQVETSTATTLDDIEQIGVDAAMKALAYFRSHGIDVIKDYENFYIFTSAGYATVNGLNTERSIYGILKVFGPKVSENIYLIHTPLWKDLIFYFLWVNGANNRDYLSYALKYVSSEGRWVVCDLCKKQGDALAYEFGLFDKKPINPTPPYPDTHSRTICLRDISAGSLVNNTNATKKDSNITNASNVSIKQVSDRIVDELPESKVNPYNILYTLTSIFMVCALFGASYSKR